MKLTEIDLYKDVIAAYANSPFNKGIMSGRLVGKEFNGIHIISYKRFDSIIVYKFTYTVGEVVITGNFSVAELFNRFAAYDIRPYDSHYRNSELAKILYTRDEFTATIDHTNPVESLRVFMLSVVDEINNRLNRSG